MSERRRKSGSRVWGLRLEHASEISGTVLYDDGSPAVSLEVKLLHKDKDGKLADLKMGTANGWGLSGSTSEVDR